MNEKKNLCERKAYDTVRALPKLGVTTVYISDRIKE